MPEQVFKAVAKFPSGKTRDLEIKLVNFRADPDEPDDMALALKYANKLTPNNVTILREGFKLIHDNPETNIEGAEALAERPSDLQTGTLSTTPLTRRPTESPDAESPPPVSRAIREEDLREGDLGAGGGDASGSGGANKPAIQPPPSKSQGRPARDQNRPTSPGS